jgi:cytochrome c oxidase assembly protein subunit 15
MNVLLLAPVWMQMVHLLVADVLWIAYVIAGASALGTEPAPAATPAVASAAMAR